MTAEGGPWVEYLTEAECWQLVAAAPFGRIAVLVDSAPEVYPINHVVDGETIVFRTDPGSKLHGIERSPSVSFEIDGADVDEHTGWSVLVKGRAVELVDPEDLERAQALPLHFWGVGTKSHWIRIVPTEVTGRRVDRKLDRTPVP